MTDWLVPLAGPLVPVAIVAFVGREWISKTLTLLVTRETEALKAAHQQTIEAQKAVQIKALEDFKQENQRAAEERNRAFQRELEDIRRAQHLTFESARHEYSRSLEAARARIQREEQWFARKLDALVRLNELALSLLPPPGRPDADWNVVLAHIEENSEPLREEVRAYRCTFEVFLPPEVRELVERAEQCLAFCGFDPRDGPNVEATEQDAWDAVTQARDTLRAHVDAERIAERPSPLSVPGRPHEDASDAQPTGTA
ncbi:MAG: hypothetical protein Q8P18_05865 [Pseudomonadota bacterium]|nr:hypothetical protein [Pseudomonadota bacterium]